VYALSTVSHIQAPPTSTTQPQAGTTTAGHASRRTDAYQNRKPKETPNHDRMNRPPQANDAKTTTQKGKKNTKTKSLKLATAVQIIIETKSAPPEGSIDYLPLVEVVVHDLLHRPGEHDVTQIPLLLRHAAAAAVLPRPAR